MESANFCCFDSCRGHNTGHIQTLPGAFELLMQSLGAANKSKFYGQYCTIQGDSLPQMLKLYSICTYMNAWFLMVNLAKYSIWSIWDIFTNITSYTTSHIFLQTIEPLENPPRIRFRNLLLGRNQKHPMNTAKNGGVLTQIMVLKKIPPVSLVTKLLYKSKRFKGRACYSLTFEKFLYKYVGMHVLKKRNHPLTINM